jgi:uncharacterized FAD-dependent dehydrogenase
MLLGFLFVRLRSNGINEVMSRIIQNLEIGIDEELEEHLSWLVPEHGPYRILRQSVDARRRHSPRFVYSLEVAEKGEALDHPTFPVPRASPSPGRERPIIVGSGPAGLFAAIRLVERGIPCLLLERGGAAEERIRGINRFWRYGQIDLRNNVCFGEGGAGLYSDGKLITRIKSPHIPYVLHRLVQFGAPEEIQYISNPHVGSDKIRRLIPRIREYLRANGCEIRFNSQVVSLVYSGGSVSGVRTENGDVLSSSQVVLATGHSATDMLLHLQVSGVHVEGKSFAMGLRVEHPQSEINKIQYREFAAHPKLGSANYRLTFHDEKTATGVYSFCMCPGGYVLSSGTEAESVVCNGMSNFNRNSPFANSAIVVTVDHEKHFPGKLLGGLEMRSRLESEAFQAVRRAGGTKELPTQSLQDFLAGKLGAVHKGSSPSGEKPVRLDELLPSFMTQYLRKGLEEFEKKMDGFTSSAAQLYGVESRTSCPIRVTRDEQSLQSLSHQGLYPCGEGAGYAGGITSAACDGIRVAEKIAEAVLSSYETLPY